MQWYSYSKTADFHQLRPSGHRCDDDCGGFEYEYCFAEYEYRFAEYDTNRKNLAPRASFLALYAVRKTHTLRVPPPHPPTHFTPPGGEGELRIVGVALQALHKRDLVLFASLQLCVSHAHPSHGLRGPCYGVATQCNGFRTQKTLDPIGLFAGNSQKFQTLQSLEC